VSTILSNHLSKRCLRLELPHLKDCDAGGLVALLVDTEGQSCPEMLPDCYGEHYQAATHKRCITCPVATLCLHRCASVRYPDVAAQAGTHNVYHLQKAWPLGIRNMRLVQAMGEHLGFALQEPHIASRKEPARLKPRKGVVTTPGDKRFARRFCKERERNPELLSLKPGMVLRRSYKQGLVRVEVGDGFYGYEGGIYPTLYDVLKVATGAKLFARPPGDPPGKPRRLSAWSTQRFFFKAIEDAIGAGP
jgi:hypothetical protein